MENKIDYDIPDEVIIDVTGKLNYIVGVLEPYLIALTPQERHELPKMSDKTIPMVEKIKDYTQSDPQYVPSFMDVEALKQDMKVYGQLMPLLHIIRGLGDGLDDTTMEAGVESYINSLNYYNSVKQATKRNVPGSKAIYEDLKKRFHRSKNKPKVIKPQVIAQ